MLPRTVTWRNWDRLYTDVSLWRGPIERVLSRLGLSLVSVDAGFPGTSAAFAVECAAGSAQGEPTDSVGGGKVPPGRYVVKFYPPMVHGDFVAEVEVRGALRTEPPPYQMWSQRASWRTASTGLTSSSPFCGGRQSARSGTAWTPRVEQGLPFKSLTCSKTFTLLLSPSSRG